MSVNVGQIHFLLQLKELKQLRTVHFSMYHNVDETNASLMEAGFIRGTPYRAYVYVDEDNAMFE